MAIIVAVITAVGAVLAAILPVLLKTRSEAGDSPPTREDLVALEGLRDILITNQALNIRYASFQSSQTPETPFSEIFSTLQLLSQEKHDVRKKLEAIKVTPRYSRLFQILNESLTSDQKLFDLEARTLRHTLGFLEVMKVPPMSAYDSLSEEEKRSRITDDLMKMRVRMKEWRKTSDILSSQDKSARVTSIQSINLLNEELEKLNLPYRHENPFELAHEPSPKINPNPPKG
ncbi:MAG: hypothetical protein ABFD80_11140 [Acidobacteriota bacterium]